MSIKVGVVVWTNPKGPNIQQWFLDYELASSFADILMRNKTIEGAVVSEFSIPFQLDKEELPKFIAWMNTHASTWNENKTK